MIEEKFDVVASLKVAAPCYVRMVDRQSDCGRAEDSDEDRAKAIHDHMLAPGSDGKVSVWFVESALDLARVALALNSTRLSLTDDILFFAIEPSRFNDPEVVYSQGRVECLSARARHRDLALTAGRRLELSRALANTRRKAKRFNEMRMKEAVARGRVDHCYSVNHEARCSCDG